MKALVLNAEVREITGKKVKTLRRQGLLPIGLYGKDVKSTALSVPLKEFAKVYAQAGQTGLVELKYDSKSEHTLIANVQIHPLTRAPLHAEFHAVKLTEKIKTEVPIELVGESPAVASGAAVLLQTIDKIEVHALPTDLPEKFLVDISRLANIDEKITVGQLEKPKGVAVLTPEEEIIVKLAPAISEEVKKEAEAAAAAKAEAVAAAGPEETLTGQPQLTEQAEKEETPITG